MLNIIKIGIVIPTINNSYFVDIIESAMQESEKYKNIQLIIQIPEKNSNTLERQIQIIDDLLTQDIDILCVIPADSRSLIPTIKKANKAEIPVIIADNPLDANLSRFEGIKIETYIGSNNYDGGKLAGKFISTKYKKGNVLILEGKFGTDAAIDRKKGFLDGLSKGIKVIDFIPADWDRETASFIVKKAIDAKTKIDYIFTCNDEMALGAVMANKEKIKKIKIIGFDGTEEAQQAIINNDMVATVLQSTEEMGKNIIKISLDYINGKEIPSNIYTPLKIIQKKDLKK